MFNNPIFDKNTFSEMKKDVQDAFVDLLIDLGIHFESYPDEITKTNIEKLKNITPLLIEEV